MNTTKITELESQVLLSINNSEYCDYIGSWTWVSDCIDANNGKINSGVISSLTKKGLVKTQGNGNDQAIAITEYGIEICKENNLTGKF